MLIEDNWFVIQYRVWRVTLYIKHGLIITVTCCNRTEKFDYSFSLHPTGKCDPIEKLMNRDRNHGWWAATLVGLVHMFAFCCGQQRERQLTRRKFVQQVQLRVTTVASSRPFVFLFLCVRVKPSNREFLVQDYRQLFRDTWSRKSNSKRISMNNCACVFNYSNYYCTFWFTHFLLLICEFLLSFS